MRPAPFRTARFLVHWLADRASVREREIGGGGEADDAATLYLPSRARGPLPSWIVLHGITRPGRRHPELVRFARALAATRAAVVVPEIPGWRELSLTPERTLPAIRRSLALLERTTEAAERPPGVVGFSFGAPQAVLAAAEPTLDGRLAGVVGFGGYCDLERTVRFQFTGEHGWRGRSHHLPPDPYGRWVMGANYLHRTPEHPDAEDVARALRELAGEAGDRRIDAFSPETDPIKERLRDRLAPSRRELFDLFAPPADRTPDRDRAEALIPSLVRVARSASPRLDPGPLLRPPPCPVRLVHGRGDRLIPFTETLRMADTLPPDADVRATVTGLFSHSRQSDTHGSRGILGEGWRFVRALSGVLGLV